jgi:hypothetical protein
MEIDVSKTPRDASKIPPTKTLGFRAHRESLAGEFGADGSDLRRDF